MNLRITLRNILLILLLLCVQSVVYAASPSASNEGLTEQKILSFMKTRDDARIRGDAATFISTLADNYTSTSEQPGQKSRKKTRDEAEASAVRNFPQFSNYQISREDIKINISQDGQSASVTAKETEKVTVGDKNVNIISLATETFELRGGKIVVTSDVWSTLEQKVSLTVWPVAARPTDCTYFPEDERVAQYDIGQAHFKMLNGLFGFSNPVPFCRMYKSDAKTVSAKVQSIMPNLGNPIKAADVANGFFSTDVMERHAVLQEWQDSYSITVQETNAGESVVRIMRPLRVNTGEGFSQKESDGNNEKWILSQITERLASQKIAPAAPPSTTQPAAPAPAAVSVEDQLKKLQDMHDKKIITDQEYKAMRAKALGL